jgi:hypothetical protein
MNLHKSLLIALFAIGAQSINAGVTFSTEEIEEKDPYSYKTDNQTGEISVEFKHDKYTREKMLGYNEGIHDTLTIGSTFALIPAAVLSFILLSPDVRPEIARSSFPKIVHAIAVLCSATLAYNLIKGWLNKKAKIALPRKERVIVGKIV